MISYDEYIAAYHGETVSTAEYEQWFLNHLTGEFCIKDKWFPCIPLSDECTDAHSQYDISVITRNGYRLYLTNDRFRMKGENNDRTRNAPAYDRN